MKTLIGALKSRTVILNALAIVALVLGSDQVKQFISPEHSAEALAIINLILRFFTTQPLSAKA